MKLKLILPPLCFTCPLSSIILMISVVTLHSVLGLGLHYGKLHLKGESWSSSLVSPNFFLYSLSWVLLRRQSGLPKVHIKTTFLMVDYLILSELLVLHPQISYAYSKEISKSPTKDSPFAFEVPLKYLSLPGI